MALLAGGLRRRNAGHGGDKRFMICEELELPTLKQETKMADGGVGGQQLSVEGASFLEKKAKGFQFFPTFCCRTPPTCESEASTERERTAFGAGWQSGTAATRAALAATNAASAAGDQSRTFGEPFNRSVRG